MKASILPPTASPLMVTLEMTARRIRDEVSSKSCVGLDLSKLWDLPSYEGSKYEHVLPYIAAAYNIPVWREEWTTRQKIDFIDSFLYCRSISGTKGAVEKSIQSLGINATVRETEEPYRFAIYLDHAISVEDRAAIVRLVEYFKRLRCTYFFKEFLTIELKVSMSAYVRCTKIQRIEDMATYKQVITNVALSAYAEAAASGGRPYQFTRFEWGSGQYVPDANQKNLQAKLGEDKVADSKAFSRPALTGGENRGVTVTGVLQQGFGATIGEIGIYISNGIQEILYAIVSSPTEPITVKVINEEILLSFDIFMSGTDMGLQLVGTGDRLNLSFADETSKIFEAYSKLELKIAELEARLIKQEIRP